MASLVLLRNLVPGWLQRGTKAYDLAAGIPLVAFYVFFAHTKVSLLYQRILDFDPYRADFAALARICSSMGSLVVAFLFVAGVLLRPPPIARAAGWMPRLAAVAGTYLCVSLLLLPGIEATGPLLAISTALIFCGTLFTAYAVFYLGRSVSLVPEARRLVTGGPYRIVRHPLYLAEQTTIAGTLLQHLSLVAIFVFPVQLCFQFYRASCEERVLAKTFPEYGKLRGAHLAVHSRHLLTPVERVVHSSTYRGTDVIRLIASSISAQGRRLRPSREA